MYSKTVPTSLAHSGVKNRYLIYIYLKSEQRNRSWRNNFIIFISLEEINQFSVMNKKVLAFTSEIIKGN